MKKFLCIILLAFSAVTLYSCANPAGADLSKYPEEVEIEAQTEVETEAQTEAQTEVETEAQTEAMNNPGDSPNPILPAELVPPSEMLSITFNGEKPIDIIYTDVIAEEASAVNTKLEELSPILIAYTTEIYLCTEDSIVAPSDYNGETMILIFVDEDLMYDLASFIAGNYISFHPEVIALWNNKDLGPLLYYEDPALDFCQGIALFYNEPTTFSELYPDRCAFIQDLLGGS